MTLSNSKAAYSDCYELFDRALATTKGIRTSAATKGKARHIYTRLQSARTILRRESMDIYQQGDPTYGTSPYDSLIVRAPILQDGEWWVYIEPRAILGKVEDLSEPIRRKVI